MAQGLTNHMIMVLDLPDPSLSFYSGRTLKTVYEERKETFEDGVFRI